MHRRRWNGAWTLGVICCLAGMIACPLQAMDHFGTQVHLAFGRGDPDAVLRMVKETGFNSYREDVVWMEFERTAGQCVADQPYLDRLAAGERQGLLPLIALGYGNPAYDKGGFPVSPEAMAGFARFSGTAAAVTRGKSAIFQVWNEWEGGTGLPSELAWKGSVPAYLQLLQKTSPAIRAAAPGVTVISNSFQKWQALKEAVAGNVSLYCDGVALHTYNYFNGYRTNAEDWESVLRSVSLPILQNGPGRKAPLYISEMGWTTSLGDKGRNEENAAAQFVRMWLLAQKYPAIKGIWIYDFMNDGWDPNEDENNFGLVRSDLTPKQPFYAVRGLLRALGDAKFAGEINTGRSGLHMMRFEHSDQRASLVMWSSYYSDDWRITLRRHGEPLKVDIAHVGYPGYQRTWDKELPVTLGMLPIIVTGPSLAYDSFSYERIARPPLAPNTPEKIQLPKRCLFAETAAAQPAFQPLPLREVWHGDKGWRGENDLSVAFQVTYDQNDILWRFKIKDDILQTGPVSDTILLKIRHPRAGNEEGNYLELSVKHPTGVPKLTVEYAAFPLEKLPTLLFANGVYTLRIPASALGVRSLERGDVLEVHPEVRDYDDARSGFFTVADFGTATSGFKASEYTSEYQYLLLK